MYTKAIKQSIILIFCLALGLLFPRNVNAEAVLDSTTQLLGVIYVKSDCPDCDKLKSKLTELNPKSVGFFEYRDIADTEANEEYQLVYESCPNKVDTLPLLIDDNGCYFGYDNALAQATVLLTTAQEEAAKPVDTTNESTDEQTSENDAETKNETSPEKDGKTLTEYFLPEKAKGSELNGWVLVGMLILPGFFLWIAYYLITKFKL